MMMNRASQKQAGETGYPRRCDARRYSGWRGLSGGETTERHNTKYYFSPKYLNLSVVTAPLHLTAPCVVSMCRYCQERPFVKVTYVDGNTKPKCFYCFELMNILSRNIKEIVAKNGVRIYRKTKK